MWLVSRQWQKIEILTNTFSDISCAMGKGRHFEASRPDWLNCLTTGISMHLRKTWVELVQLAHELHPALWDFLLPLCCKLPEFWFGISPCHTGYATYDFPRLYTGWFLGFQWNFSEDNVTLQNNYVGQLCSSWNLISSKFFIIYFWYNFWFQKLIFFN